MPRLLYDLSASFSSGGRLSLLWPFRLQWLQFTRLRFFLFGLLTGGLSLRLLPSVKQPSVTMKTKAKKTSSDSEIINFAYILFSKEASSFTSNILLLVARKSCRYVSYVLVELNQWPERMTLLAASVCYPNKIYQPHSILIKVPPC